MDGSQVYDTSAWWEGIINLRKDYTVTVQAMEGPGMEIPGYFDM